MNDEIEKALTQNSEPIPNTENIPIRAGFETIKPITSKPDVKEDSSESKSTLAATIRHDEFFYNKFSKASNELKSLGEYLNVKEQEEFNPLNSELLNNYPQSMWPALVTARTQGEFFRMGDRLRQDEIDMQTISESPFYKNLGASALVSLTNPFYWAPIGAGVRSAQIGTGFVKGALKAVPGIAMAETLSEINLHSDQELRSIEESANNIVFSTLFGSLLSGAGSAIRSTRANIYKDMIDSAGLEYKLAGFTFENHFKVNESGDVTGFRLYNNSSGKMEFKDIDLHGEKLLGLDGNGKLTAAAPFIWTTGKIGRNPVVLALMGRSKTAAGFVNDMLDHNMDIVKNVVKGENIAQSVQAKIYKYNNVSNAVRRESYNHYYDYLGFPKDQPLRNLARSVGKQLDGKALADKKSYADFSKEVISTLVTEDPSKIPQANSLAKLVRENVYDPLTADLIALKILPADIEPKAAVAYINRIYDVPFLKQKKDYAVRFLKEKFNETNDKVREETRVRDSLRAELEPHVKPMEELESIRKRFAEEDLPTKEIDATIAFAKVEIDKIKERLRLEDERINAKIASGEYSDDMVVGKGKDKTLRAVRSAADIELAAKDTYSKLIGMSQEQLASQMLGNSSAGGKGSIFKERELMINDKELYDAGFLAADITRNVDNFVTMAGRAIEMRKYLDSRGYKDVDTPVDFLHKSIDADYEKIEAIAKANFEEKIKGKSGKDLEKLQKERAKEELKINKEKELSRDVVTDVYRRIMGSYDRSQRKLITTARFFKNWAYSTQLGGLAFLTLQDAVAPIFRYGAKSYVENGVLPFVKNIIKMKHSDNVRIREELADLNIGNELLSATFDLRHGITTAGIDVPINIADAAMAKAASAMGVVNLSTPMTDVFKALSGSIASGKTIRTLQKFLDGTISSNESIYLRSLGLADKKIAQEITAQFKKHGETLSGGYLLNWKNWDDLASKDLVQTAVSKQVNATIFSGTNIASYPMGLDPSGLASSLLMYMGWAFNASANFTIPLAQRFDPAKVQGAVAMMAVSMLVDPLRSIRNNKEPNLEPVHLIKMGAINAGLGGIVADLFMRFNAGGTLFDTSSEDRFGNKGIELLSGMPGSAFNAVKEAAYMGRTLQANEKGVKKIVRLIPLLDSLGLRPVINSYLEWLDLPENREAAANE